MMVMVEAGAAGEARGSFEARVTAEARVSSKAMVAGRGTRMSSLPKPSLPSHADYRRRKNQSHRGEHDDSELLDRHHHIHGSHLLLHLLEPLYRGSVTRAPGIGQGVAASVRLRKCRGRVPAAAWFCHSIILTASKCNYRAPSRRAGGGVERVTCRSPGTVPISRLRGDALAGAAGPATAGDRSP